MAIGALYNSQNVVVGQAAALFAPVNTPLPSLLALNMNDPFDITAWLTYSVAVGATSTYTLSVNGVATSSLTNSSTTVAIQAALQALLPAYAAATVTVTGTPTAYTVVFSEGVVAPGGFTSQITTGTAAITGGLWTPVGATDQGWKFGANKTSQSINIEEQSTDVAQTISKQVVTIEGSLSEDISSVLALAFNATISRTAAAVGNPGYDLVTPTDLVQYYAVALLTQHVNGMPRIVYAPKWSQLTNTSVTFRRAAAKRMYPAVFTTACQTNQIGIYNFTSAHL